MARGWLPVLGWCASTAAGVAVASVALVPVLHTAVPDAVAPLAADNVHKVETVPQPAALPGSTRPSAAPTSGRPVNGSHAPAGTPSASGRPTGTPSASVSYQDGWTVLTDASGAKS